MKIKNYHVQRDLYFMVLNLPHRRLIVDDSYRLFQTPPQKKVYSSCGCLVLRCPYGSRTYMTCNKCFYSYDVREL